MVDRLLLLVLFSLPVRGMAAREGGREGGQVLRPNYTCSSFVLSWLELPVGGGRRLRVGEKKEEEKEGRKEGRSKGQKLGNRPNQQRGVGRQRRSDRRTMDEEKRGGMKVCGIVHIASRGSIFPAGFPG